MDAIEIQIDVNYYNIFDYILERYPLLELNILKFHLGINLIYRLIDKNISYSLFTKITAMKMIDFWS